MLATVAVRSSCSAATYLIDCGFRHERFRRYSDAERCYEEALELIESSTGMADSSKELLAETLRKLARVCKMQGKLAESALLVDRAERMDSGTQPLAGSAGFWALLGGAN